MTIFNISYGRDTSERISQITFELANIAISYEYSGQPLLEITFNYDADDKIESYDLEYVQDVYNPTKTFKPICDLNIPNTPFTYQSTLSFPDIDPLIETNTHNIIKNISLINRDDGGTGTYEKEYFYTIEKHKLPNILDVIITFTNSNNIYQPEIQSYKTDLFSLLFNKENTNSPLYLTGSVSDFAFTFQTTTDNAGVTTLSYIEQPTSYDPSSDQNVPAPDTVGGYRFYGNSASSYTNYAGYPITDANGNITHYRYYIIATVVHYYDSMNLSDVIMAKYANYFKEIKQYDTYYSVSNLNNDLQQLQKLFYSIDYQVKQYSIDEINRSSESLAIKLKGIQNNLNQNTDTIEKFEESVNNISAQAKSLFDIYNQMNEINNANKAFYTEFNTNFKEAVSEKVEDVYSSLKFLQEGFDIAKEALESLSFAKKMHNIENELKKLTDALPINNTEINRLNSNYYIGPIAGLVIGALTVIGIKAYTGNSQTEINNHQKISEFNNLDLLENY